MIHIDAEMVLLVDSFDKPRQSRVIDLLDCIAVAADEMMMRLVASNLVIGPVAPLHGVNHVNLAQEIKRAIDRRTADGWILLVHAGIHLLGCDMRASFADDVQYKMALRRKPVALHVELIRKIGVSS